MVRSQPQASSLQDPSQKKRAGRVAQGVGPEFKPQYHKKKKKMEMVMLPLWILTTTHRRLTGNVCNMSQGSRQESLLWPGGLV
jgi:hypothetical protein